MKELIIDKASLKRFLKSAEKHIQVVESLMCEGTCVNGGKLADEFNRFEKSVYDFKDKNKLP